MADSSAGLLKEILQYSLIAICPDLVEQLLDLVVFGVQVVLDFAQLRSNLVFILLGPPLDVILIDWISLDYLVEACAILASRCLRIGLALPCGRPVVAG